MTKNEKIIEKAKQLMLLMNEDGSPVDGFRFREFVLELRTALQDEGEEKIPFDKAVDRASLNAFDRFEFIKGAKWAQEFLVKEYKPIELKNLKNPE